MKIWVDDVRPAPEGYSVHCKTVNQIKANILLCDMAKIPIELIDLDHDAGDYAKLGGDYYKILDWCEAHGYKPVVHFHSMNPVGVEKMRQIAQHNHWEEI